MHVYTRASSCVWHVCTQVHTAFTQLKELAQSDAAKKADAAAAKASKAPGRGRGGGGNKKKTVRKTFSESLGALVHAPHACIHTALLVCMACACIHR